jgi:coenzyme F420-0:L-glutamate ligase/coenzyme F420-1:gamma-L-glutamate ligase
MGFRRLEFESLALIVRTWTIKMALVLTPITGIPLIYPGDDLPGLLIQALKNSQIEIQDGDILVVTQKIISKAEGRFVNLTTVEPSPEAYLLAEKTAKDVRFVELVLRESVAVLRTRPGTLIVEHRCGFVCANAGIDHSNVQNLEGNPEDWVLLLPEDPSRSAETLRDAIENIFKLRIAIIIIDTHGRAWRNGTVGISIGFSGLPGVVDFRGRPDMFGYQLQVTQVAVADELSAAASLMMGQADENIPVVHVRGFPYPLRDGSFSELIRPKELDLFR